MKIRCSTLFNITKTGVNTRREPNGLTKSEMEQWNVDRKQQANYETMLQVINMRAQPEEITDPIKTEINFTKDGSWGYLFEKHKDQVSCWHFEFTVSYGSVFNDGITELGALVTDCNGVPMITGLGEWSKLPNHLDISREQCNIIFEVINEQEKA